MTQDGITSMAPTSGRRCSAPASNSRVPMSSSAPRPRHVSTPSQLRPADRTSSLKQQRRR
ncbi:hypothetical protein E4U43_006960, partial [Claviceps pusilla]